MWNDGTGNQIDEMIGKNIIHQEEKVRSTYYIYRRKVGCKNAQWREKYLILKKIKLWWVQPVLKPSTKGCCEKEKCITESFLQCVTWIAGVCVLLAYSAWESFGHYFPNRLRSKGKILEPQGQNNWQGNWKDRGCVQCTKESTTVFKYVKCCCRDERN